MANELNLSPKLKKRKRMNLNRKFKQKNDKKQYQKKLVFNIGKSKTKKFINDHNYLLDENNNNKCSENDYQIIVNNNKSYKDVLLSEFVMHTLNNSWELVSKKEITNVKQSKSIFGYMKGFFGY